MTALLPLVALQGILLVAGQVYNEYDCTHGLPNWESEWSAAQQDWCCRERAVGCAASASEPFDCNADRQFWQSSWSSTKQAWCCDKYGAGCAETTTQVHNAYVEAGDRIYNCVEGLEDVRHLWDIEKQAHCCSQRGLGCPDNAFDCDSGYINWVHGWSEGKKIWCCARTNRGCPPTTVTATSTGTTTGTTTYPACSRHCGLNGVSVSCAERVHYASVHIFLGEVSPCQLAHQLVLHECGIHCQSCPVSDACFGAANVDTSTLPPTTLPSTSTEAPHFDCHEGLDKWQFTWFPAKQDWCCEHMKLGCFTTAPPATTVIVTTITTTLLPTRTVTSTIPPSAGDSQESASAVHAGVGSEAPVNDMDASSISTEGNASIEGKFSTLHSDPHGPGHYTMAYMAWGTPVVACAGAAVLAVALRGRRRRPLETHLVGQSDESEGESPDALL